MKYQNKNIPDDENALKCIKAMLDRESSESLHKKVAAKITTLPSTWEDISKRIKARDKYVCAFCGKKPEPRKTIIHHRDGNQDNNDPSNLITLCYDCHDALPVRPVTEMFYCKTIVHRWYHPICIRLGYAGGVRDSDTCEFFSKKHGCLLAAFNLNLRKDEAITYNGVSI